MIRSCTCEEDLQLTSTSPCEWDHSPRQCHKTHIIISTHLTRPYQAMSTRPYNIPCYTSPGHTIYHAMLGRQYHIPCQTSPGHTMPCPQGHTIYRAIPHQAIRYTMSCLTGRTIYHAISHRPITYTIPQFARPIHIPCGAQQAMPCPLDHTIYNAIPARPYHVHYIPPGHAIYHPIPRQVIPYTMPCPPVDMAQNLHLFPPLSICYLLYSNGNN